MEMNKVSFPIDKHQWQPSLIPGPVVLISTYDKGGNPNIAPKSWVQMVSFDPPMLMFSGTRENTTEINILAGGCFGVNLVDSSMASIVYRCIEWHGQERIRKTGFQLFRAAEINAPLVHECKAHLECRLHSTEQMGSGFLVFGEIVASSIWDEILAAEQGKQYEMLDQIVFLEDRLYSTISQVRSLDASTS